MNPIQSNYTKINGIYLSTVAGVETMNGSFKKVGVLDDVILTIIYSNYNDILTYCWKILNQVPLMYYDTNDYGAKI